MEISNLYDFALYVDIFSLYCSDFKKEIFENSMYNVGY